VNGHYEQRIWEPTPGAYPPLARLQRGFKYQAFVPDCIAERDWSIPAHVAEDIVRAETAINSLNALPHMASIEAMSRLLRRAEKGQPAWEWIGPKGVQTQQDFEVLVAQAREEGTRNDDMTLIRVSRRPDQVGG